MKYTHNYTTRWHDTDAFRNLRASKILMYLQETGNLQCREYGIDLDTLRDEKGVGFILSSISVKVNRPIHAFEKISVSTWCREARGYAFSRFFDIKAGDELVVQASSLWALVDVNSKTLVKASDDMTPHFPYDEPIPASDLPPRARILKTDMLEKLGNRKICYSDIDYNNHMNNTNYPDMLCDFVPDMRGKFVKEISLLYLKEAPYGETIAVFGSRDGDTYKFKTQNSAGETCLEAIMTLGEA